MLKFSGSIHKEYTDGDTIRFTGVLQGWEKHFTETAGVLLSLPNYNGSYMLFIAGLFPLLKTNTVHLLLSYCPSTLRLKLCYQKKLGCCVNPVIELKLIITLLLSSVCNHLRSTSQKHWVTPPVYLCSYVTQTVRGWRLMVSCLTVYVTCE